jgi:hypothetical protein
LPISAINLEISMGFADASSRFRSTMDFSQLLDLYHQLDLPLQVRLYFPSGDEAGAATPAGGRGRSSEELQADWLEGNAIVALSKSYVEQVSWGRFNDGPGDWRALSGLFAADGRPKRAVKRFRAIRRACFP